MIDPGAYAIAFGWDPAGEIHRLVGLCASPPRRVLELGCGTGRLLGAFAARGVAGVGIELSRAMVDYARGQLPDGVEVHLGDMSRCPLPGSFDLVYASANTLRHLVEDDDLRRLLRRVADWIRPDGTFVVDLELGRAHFDSEIGRANTWTNSRDGVEVRATWRVVAIEGGRAITELLLETRRGGTWDPVSTRFPLRCDDAATFLDHAEACGLTLRGGGILREPELLDRPGPQLEGRCVLAMEASRANQQGSPRP